MKKLLLLVFFFTFLILAAPVSAHILKTDGNIGAVLHIDPNDSPSASQPASLIFDFKNTKGTFDLSKCTCNLSVYKGSSSLSTQSIFAASDKDQTTAVINYTFPDPAVYTLKVTGTSLDSSFQNFTLTYDVRVEDLAAGNSFSPSTSLFLLWGIVILVILGALWLFISVLKSRGNRK